MRHGAAAGGQSQDYDSVYYYQRDEIAVFSMPSTDPVSSAHPLLRSVSQSLTLLLWYDHTKLLQINHRWLTLLVYYNAVLDGVPSPRVHADVAARYHWCGTISTSQSDVTNVHMLNVFIWLYIWSDAMLPLATAKRSRHIYSCHGMLACACADRPYTWNIYKTYSVCVRYGFILYASCLSFIRHVPALLRRRPSLAHRRAEIHDVRAHTKTDLWNKNVASRKTQFIALIIILVILHEQLCRGHREKIFSVPLSSFLFSMSHLHSSLILLVFFSEWTKQVKDRRTSAPH